MVLCWAQQPRDRPSASQIVSIASAPEFTHLADVVSLSHAAVVAATAVVPLNEVGGVYKIIINCSHVIVTACLLLRGVHVFLSTATMRAY